MDLLITTFVLCYCGFVLFRLGNRFGLENPHRGQFLCATAILLAVWSAWTAESSLRWAQILPFSSVVLVANSTVLIIVGVAGLIAGSQMVGGLRRVLLAMALCMTAGWFITGAMLQPLLNPVVLDGKGKWRDGVCLQRHEASCAPAAVATLLAQHGIIRSEAQMATACLTSTRGTLALGAYRGLCVGTSGSDSKPATLVTTPSPQALATVSQHLPMLIHVNYEQQQPANLPASRPAWFGSLWHQGGHAVVLLDREADGRWVVADPASGRVRWTTEYIQEIWVGEGLYLQRP